MAPVSAMLRPERVGRSLSALAKSMNDPLPLRVEGRRAVRFTYSAGRSLSEESSDTLGEDADTVGEGSTTPSSIGVSAFAAIE